MRRTTAWALKRTPTGRRTTTWRLTPAYCAWSSICGGIATSVVPHQQLGTAPACDLCAHQLAQDGGAR